MDRYSLVQPGRARCAAGGIWSSLVPRPYVESDLREGRLECALDDWTSVETTLYAVYPSRQHLAPKIRVFVDFLVEEFGRTGNEESAGPASVVLGRGQ